MKNNTLKGPLKSWDIFSVSMMEQAATFERNTEISILKEFKEKYKWRFDVEEALGSSTFEAIVLTNLNQEIEWVSKGFVKMTGYPVNFSKGKRPKFLQGKASSRETLDNIRENIKKELHFKERVVNYRKNGEQYLCDIEIFPLKNDEGELSHLLALEKEVHHI